MVGSRECRRLWVWLHGTHQNDGDMGLKEQRRGVDHPDSGRTVSQWMKTFSLSHTEMCGWLYYFYGLKKSSLLSSGSSPVPWKHCLHLSSCCDKTVKSAPPGWRNCLGPGNCACFTGTYLQLGVDLLGQLLAIAFQQHDGFLQGFKELISSSLSASHIQKMAHDVD